MVAVLGAGTLGLLVTAALGHLAAAGRCAAPSAVLVGARYAHQQRLAREFGATEALAPDQLPRAVRRLSLCPPTAVDRAPRRPCRAVPTWCSTAWAAPSRSPSPWPWSVPAERWPSSACRARSPLTSLRSGTARSAWPVPTPTAPKRGGPGHAASTHVRARLRGGRGAADRTPGHGHVPAHALRGRAVPRRGSRTPRRRQVAFDVRERHRRRPAR